MRWAATFPASFLEPDAGNRTTPVRPSAVRLLACLLATSSPMCWTVAQASTAGTVVSDTAALSFDMDGAGRTVSSNTVRIVLVKRLDVIVTADAPTALVTGGDEQAVAFRVSNWGERRGEVRPGRAVRGDGASVPVLALAADDGNGVHDPNIDRKLPDARLLLDQGTVAEVRSAD